MISVVIPAFNCQDTIAETLDSIIEGNLHVVAEVIVADDCSTDGTSQLLAEYAARVPVVKVLSHSENRGGAAARNTATRAATSEYIFCLDSDNVLAPSSLSALENFARNNDADVASFRELHYFTEERTAVSHRWRFKIGEISLGDYLAGLVVPGASGNYLYRRKAWEDVGGYPEDSRALDAWGFGLRLVGAGKRMLVMPDGHYFHRFGHESYWVRERRRNDTSKLARRLLAPYENQLHTESIEYLDRHPDGWFEDLDRHPILLKDGRRGTAGEVIRPLNLDWATSLVRRYMRLLVSG